MTEMSDEEAELWERAQQAGTDPYAEEKQKVLGFIGDLPASYTSTENIVEYLEAKRGLRQQEVAGVLLEMRVENLIEFQAIGGGESVLVYITSAGRSVVDLD